MTITMARSVRLKIRAIVKNNTILLLVYQQSKLSVPYISGFLAFREAPHFVNNVICEKLAR